MERTPCGRHQDDDTRGVEWGRDRPMSPDTTEGTPFDDAEWNAWEESQNRSRDECVRKIVACFTDVARELGRETAWEFFSTFTKLVKPPPRKKGKHDRDFDRVLLEAHASAPASEKMAAIRAVGRAHKKTDEATERRLRRLLKEQKEEL